MTREGWHKEHNLKTQINTARLSGYGGSAQEGIHNDNRGPVAVHPPFLFVLIEEICCASWGGPAYREADTLDLELGTHEMGWMDGMLLLVGVCVCVPEEVP
jgi:hypothetical protein